MWNFLTKTSFVNNDCIIFVNEESTFVPVWQQNIMGKNIHGEPVIEEPVVEELVHDVVVEEISQNSF
jgi:hypothetical protein